MTSANAAFTGSYDYIQVALSALIAVSASYAALDLGGRVAAASGWIRSVWLTGGAVAMGTGIWSMHFVAMMAFSLPVPVNYNWPTVLVSFLVGIFCSAFALYVVSRHKMDRSRAVAGSVLMGTGIAGLHYIGMNAMRVAAVCHFDLRIVALSVLFAIVFSLAALLLAFDMREETRGTPLRKAASALVMAAAVSAMHYTGMASASFIPAAFAPDLSHATSISSLETAGIGIVTLTVLGVAIVTSSVDRRAKAEVQRLNQELEQRVAERTLQLEAVNQALRKDIVERERAEEAVRQSEDHLRLVIDTIPQQIWSGPGRPDTSPDFCNAQWRSYTGLTVEEMQGGGWRRILHPDDRERVLKAWRESMMSAAPFEQEVRHRGADGQYRWFLVRIVPLRDSAGHIARWYGTNTDIEDRKRAENELRKQKEVFQKIFENIPVMIAFMGEDGRIEMVNPEWERTIGWTLEETREPNRDTLAELFPDPQYRQMVRDVITASTGEWTDFKVRARDGRILDVAADLVRLSDGSSLSIGTDITERKLVEQSLQEAQAELAHVTRALVMGELVASIAHEVNQPLTGVVTNGNFALRELASGTPNLGKLREVIAEIVEDGTRASAVISRIRALLEKGAPARIALDINEVIKDVSILVGNEATRCRVSVNLDLTFDLPRVLCDRVQLQQVLINLAMNGIDAMRTMIGRSRQLLMRSSKSANGVLIQVQDSGIGFDPDQVDRIFEPFFTTKPQGIGMGLSISRSIIESHGGRLWAETGSHGALLQFTLPTIGNSAS